MLMSLWCWTCWSDDHIVDWIIYYFQAKIYPDQNFKIFQMVHAYQTSVNVHILINMMILCSILESVSFSTHHIMYYWYNFLSIFFYLVMVIFFFLVSLLMVVLQPNIFVNVIVNSCRLLCMVHGFLMVFN